MRRIAPWVTAGFVLWWIIVQPQQAAHAVHQIGAALTAASTGFSRFLADL